MHIRRFLFLLFVVAALAFDASPPLLAQSTAKTFTLTAVNQCAPISVTGLSTVGIDIGGTFSLTLQPSVSINGGASRNTSATSTVSGSQPQATITATGGYKASVGGFDNFSLCVSAYTSGSVTIVLNPSGALNAGLLGGTSIPILNANGIAPASFANECASVTVDTSGNALTAIAFLRTMGNAGVVHDVMCMVTADAVFPSTIGAIVFPFGATISPGAARATAPKNVLSIANTAGAAVLELSNLTGTNRQNSINFRTCAGPGGTNCGTDLVILEDPTSTFKEEFLFQLPGGNYPLYMGNVLNSAHGGIMLGGADASCLLNVTTCASFGLLRPPAGSTNSDHLVRLSTHADMWNTATMAAGTVTVTFQSAFTSAPICIATWQGGGVLTGIVKCVTSTTTAVLSSSVNTDTAVMGYLILGNNN